MLRFFPTRTPSTVFMKKTAKINLLLLTAILAIGFSETKAEAKKTARGPARIVVANIDQTNMAAAVDLFQRAGAKVTRTTNPKIDPQKYDGLVIPGSSHDVHPHYYHEKVTRAYNLDKRWDRFRFKMIRKFVLAGKPVFGICGGCQSINVLFGGSLKQNIDGHRSAWLQAKVSKKSIFYSFLGSRHYPYHYHHECPKKLGSGFIAAEWASDGNIEAIQHKKYPIYGVQYHPEYMGKEGEKIAKKFMSICIKYRKKPMKVNKKELKFIKY